jgi:lipid-binding SYLF domain-containing protein
MNSSLVRLTVSLAALCGAVSLVGCGSSSSSAGAGEAQTTAATAGKMDPDKAKELTRLDESAQLLNSFREKIPDDVAHASQCVVSIPSMAKGGIVIGATGGSGFASCRTSSGWSAPAPITMGGGTLGAQLGYQETDVVALVTSSKGMQGLSSGNLKVGVDASATAGPVGTGRGTGSDVGTGTDMVSYSRSKGLFAGAELNGNTIKLDDKAAKALYGPGTSMEGILRGRTPTPSEPGAQAFMTALKTGFGTR